MTEFVLFLPQHVIFAFSWSAPSFSSLKFLSRVDILNNDWIEAINFAMVVQRATFCKFLSRVNILNNDWIEAINFAMVVQRATFCNTWRDIFHSNRQRRVLSLYYIAVVVVSFFFFGQITAFCKFYKCFHDPRTSSSKSLGVGQKYFIIYWESEWVRKPLFFKQRRRKAQKNQVTVQASLNRSHGVVSQFVFKLFALRYGMKMK